MHEHVFECRRPREGQRQVQHDVAVGRERTPLRTHALELQAPGRPRQRREVAGQPAADVAAGLAFVEIAQRTLQRCLRRMLGLFGFAYATLHVSTYVGIDQFFDWQAIVADILKRPFIFVGFAAFVLLIPLAVTSTAAWVKRLGYARWKQLHRLAYIAPLLGVLHFTWRVKKDVSEPLTYAFILGILLLIRVAAALYERRTVMLASLKST